MAGGFREMESTDQNSDLDAIVADSANEYQAIEFVDVEDDCARIEPTADTADQNSDIWDVVDLNNTVEDVAPHLNIFPSNNELDYLNIQELSVHVQPVDEEMHEEPITVSELLTPDLEERLRGSLR